MSLEPQLVRLKELIFAVDNVPEQQRLIRAIIEEYKKESEGANRLGEDHSALQQKHSALQEAHLKLELAQAEKPPKLVPHNGVLWKQIETGFERNPYCAECPHHPVMRRPAPMARFWVCSQGHTAPLSNPPPQGEIVPH